MRTRTRYRRNLHASAPGRIRLLSACANTAADRLTVLDATLAQIPDAHRHGTTSSSLSSNVTNLIERAGALQAQLVHMHGRSPQAPRHVDVGEDQLNRVHTLQRCPPHHDFTRPPTPTARAAAP
ncbi:hypothetical protein [Streptomyces milbemycinicus]|uniref:Uncharacterized protein n=1 Tax=Streptomyces milbemycinicus TaxID=476552 RepID=A0ABW8MBW1_9ACTN